MIRFLRRELILFLSSVRFNTRIAVPDWVEHSEELLASSVRYFPLVGWIIACITIFVFLGSRQILPAMIAAVLSICASVFATGAFHEDGFTDVCDGFGGGWNKEKILEIMKDSRIGAFGAIGIVLLLLLKSVCYFFLTDLPFFFFMIAVWSSHASSRFFANAMAVSLPYAREDELSKVKSIVKSMKVSDVFISAIWGLGPCLLLPFVQSSDPLRYSLMTFIPLGFQSLGFVILRNFYNKRLGGYTGDCLGAVQQVTEILSLLGAIVAWKYY
ncbi:adenosylcobinamide-GDP ribazoletransferase [Leptospira fluminis]|uniref:Adenosylcobinamide-GDP ribazoletransferase n=1 Tax=Leptospira fluminis TaxID=2484979 RepID=A0A4R9GS75_9LEPT|nr:adenosylcobinamide-GDP ribazoletransferase [Leptospira fluminis]TGK21024.1 adenosylcobinamide-GDP ribazoletransferase [Leptospira fluminis]